MRWAFPLSIALASAGTALSAQSVELSGSANAGLVYDSDAARSVSPSNEVNFLITGFGQSDSGLEFGAFIEVDEDTSNDGTDTSDNNGVADAEVYVKGQFGTITLGGVDPATDGFGIADIGFSGLGVDDVAEQFKNATAGADVLYTYSTGGITFTASAELGDESSYGLSAEYAAGPISLGLGFVDDTDAGNSAVSVAAGYRFGSVSVNGLYSDWSSGSQGYGIDLTLDAGPAQVTAAWAQARGAAAADPADGLGDAYGLGVAVPLGGGLTLSGGLGVIETDAVTDGSKTVADFGVTMNF